QHVPSGRPPYSPLAPRRPVEPRREQEALRRRERLRIADDVEPLRRLDIEAVLLDLHRANITPRERQRPRNPLLRHPPRLLVDLAPPRLGDALVIDGQIHANAHAPP